MLTYAGADAAAGGGAAGARETKRRVREGQRGVPLPNTLTNLN